MKFALWASEIASLWNICSANVKYSLMQMWANFISHRTQWDISQFTKWIISPWAQANDFIKTVYIQNYTQNWQSHLFLRNGHLEGGFERRLLVTCRWHVATAVAFPQKSESVLPHQKSPIFDRRLAIFTSSLLPIHSSWNPSGDFGKVISNSE